MHNLLICSNCVPVPIKFWIRKFNCSFKFVGLWILEGSPLIIFPSIVPINHIDEEFNITEIIENKTEIDIINLYDFAYLSNLLNIFILKFKET